MNDLYGLIACHIERYCSTKELFQEENTTQEGVSIMVPVADLFNIKIIENQKLCQSQN